MTNSFSTMNENACQQIDSPTNLENNFEMISSESNDENCSQSVSNTIQNQEEQFLNNLTSDCNSSTTKSVTRNEEAYRFYEQVLGAPRLIVGPMVDQSEQPFRTLCRNYGAQLCYTPMLSASQFVNDVRYRNSHLIDCCSDRPLIVQFCCNQPELFLQAAKLAVGHCDAIDLNLGCPQGIAKRGHYGAFLQDEWDVLYKMINLVHKELPQLPVTCKIRVFPSEKRTLDYAKMLQSAGCQLLTVHGRTREMKGHNTGLANWNIIRKVKETLSIPVFANGNIQSMEDVQECLRETGVEGVMSAEGLLHNPALFSEIHPPIWTVAHQYLHEVKRFPCHSSCVRGHLFKIFFHALRLERNHDLREQLSKVNEIEQFEEIVQEFRSRYEQPDQDQCIPMSTYPLPVHVAQAYYRPSPAECNISKKLLKERQSVDNEQEDSEDVSKPKKQKVEKLSSITEEIKKKKSFETCSTCSNPRSNRCEQLFCRSCCKSHSFKNTLDCKAHKIFYATKKERVVETKLL